MGNRAHCCPGFVLTGAAGFGIRGRSRAGKGACPALLRLWAILRCRLLTAFGRLDHTEGKTGDLIFLYPLNGLNNQ